MQDRYGRTITYLRMSVTELCNLRCRYCMPVEGVEKKCHENMLSEEEQTRLTELEEIFLRGDPDGDAYGDEAGRIQVSAIAEIPHGIEDGDIMIVFHALQDMGVTSHNQVTAPVSHIVCEFYLPVFRLREVFYGTPVHKTDDQVTSVFPAFFDIRFYGFFPYTYIFPVLNGIIGYDSER